MRPFLREAFPRAEVPLALPSSRVARWSPPRRTVRAPRRRRPRRRYALKPSRSSILSASPHRLRTRSPRRVRRCRFTRHASSSSAASDLDAFVRACCADLGRGEDDETVAAVADALRATVDASSTTSRTSPRRAMSPAPSASPSPCRRLSGAAVSTAPEPPSTRDPSVPKRTTSRARRGRRLRRRHRILGSLVGSLLRSSEASSEASSASSEASSEASSASSEASSASPRARLFFAAASCPAPSAAKLPNAADAASRADPRAREWSTTVIPISSVPELLDEVCAFLADPHHRPTRRRRASREVTAKKYEDQIRGLWGRMRLTIPRAPHRVAHVDAGGFPPRPTRRGVGV